MAEVAPSHWAVILANVKSGCLPSIIRHLLTLSSSEKRIPCSRTPVITQRSHIYSSLFSVLIASGLPSLFASKSSMVCWVRTNPSYNVTLSSSLRICASTSKVQLSSDESSWSSFTSSSAAYRCYTCWCAFYTSPACACASTYFFAESTCVDSAEFPLG